VSFPIWRIERVEFAKDVRKGDGPRLCGGRWNSPGRPAIYCAASLSLAMLEILAHVTTDEDAGVARVYFQIGVLKASVEEFRIGNLPRTWRSALDVRACRLLGDAWLKRGSSVILKVPSAVNPLESNFIVNPVHPLFAKTLKWEKPKSVKLDARLLENIKSAN
jgi:RES domain-containing protein